MVIRQFLFCLLLVSAGASRSWATLALRLDASEPSPIIPGQAVEWSVGVVGAPADGCWYRYQVRLFGGGEFRVIRDFGPNPTLLWTALEEGIYEVEVVVVDRSTHEGNAASALFEVRSPGRNGPVVNGTSHSLVFVYSAPPCENGATIWVQFEADGVPLRRTPAVPCDAAKSRSFYLAGLRRGLTYRAQQIVELNGVRGTGTPVPFSTPQVDLPAAPYTLVQPPPDSGATDFIVQSPLNQLQVATDLSGNVVWYHASEIQTITRLEAGGMFWGLVQDPYGDGTRQIVREFDLQGLTVRETNAARVNEQLIAMGNRPITAFHHEARTLPDGRIAILASTEEVFADVQGEGPRSIIGDSLVVLDSNLQVVWYWDGFAFLDVGRPAVLGEICTPAGGGCPPFFLLPEANDWTHANSIQFTPDGDFLVSLRHLDWVIKIDYDNGFGTGEVLWRLGRDGDFTPLTTDPDPWFSHQHDAHFVSGDPTRLILFDNGNTHRVDDPDAQSRVQIWKLNEAERTAELETSVNVGSYSLALGSAQRLPSGNLYATSGIINGTRTEFVEVQPDGRIVYRLGVPTQMYRGIRVADLYTPPN